jgi:hypothetical protein
LPANAPAELAMFETRRCERLDFRNCTLTIRGQPGYHGRVAFFDILAAPGSGSMAMNPGVADDHVVEIKLENCIVRGEATLLRDDDLQAVRLAWENGVLATSERLFSAEGSALVPQKERAADLTLRHVTAMVGSGLVLLVNSVEAPYQLMTRVACDDCILATRGKAPLVAQRGSDEIETYQKRFEWRGDHNYFDGFEVFREIMNAAGQIGSKKVDFADWKSFWGGRTDARSAGPHAVIWRGLPATNRPFHTHSATDYALDVRTPNNAPVGGASDKSDAGAVLGYLPGVPE